MALRISRSAVFLGQPNIVLLYYCFNSHHQKSSIKRIYYLHTHYVYSGARIQEEYNSDDDYSDGDSDYSDDEGIKTVYLVSPSPIIPTYIRYRPPYISNMMRHLTQWSEFIPPELLQ